MIDFFSRARLKFAALFLLSVACSVPSARAQNAPATGPAVAGPAATPTPSAIAPRQVVGPTVIIITPTPVPNPNAPVSNSAAVPAGAADANANIPNIPPLPAPSIPAEPVKPEAAKPILPEKGALTINGMLDDMSVFAVGVDAAELFTAIAAKADLKLLVDDAVSRRITVNILRRPARQIVADISAAYGLGLAEIDDVLMISEGIPRAPGSYLLSQIESVPAKYVDAANVRNLLPVFLQDYVKVNSEQNSVVLSAPPDVLDKFRSDIARFDTPASQILVDLLVVELTDTDINSLGLNFTYGNAGEGFSFDSGGAVFRAISTLPQSFQFTLRALQEKGRARVRANPRIATVSGRRASIFVGRQRYIVTPIDTGSGQRNFIDAGVRLGITPFTGGQGQILVDVDAEVSTLSAVDPITRLPEKSTRTADSIVRVADGQTIIIGGLKQQETREVRTRIPVLGDLPLLGPLFRSRDIRKTDSDLLIFITPRTLSDNGHLPEDEEARLKDQFLTGPLNSPLPAPVENSNVERLQQQERARIEAAEKPATSLEPENNRGAQ